MVAQHARGDVGRRLREARERRGLSLRQISNATKIAMMTLEALERNDVARLPGGIFSRAFVRAYALEVGLDPEVVIEEFMGQFPQDSVTVGHPRTSRIEDHEAIESDRRTATTFLRLLALSIPIAAAVAYLGSVERRQAAVTSQQSAVGSQQAPVASRESAVGARQAVVGSQEAAVDGRQSAVDSQFEPAVVPSDRLVVQVAALRPVWVSAIVDGTRATQREFKPGEEAIFEVRKEMVLTVGDAGGVAVKLNGTSARPIGGDGQVVTLRVNPANFKHYLVAS